MSEAEESTRLVGTLNQGALYVRGKHRDWLGGSFLRDCRSCRDSFFARDGDEICRQCSEALDESTVSTNGNARE